MRLAGEAEKLTRLPCMEILFLNWFMKKLRWWAVRPSNSMQFLRWHNFHCFAAPRLLIDMTRKAPCLYSKTTASAGFATIARHGAMFFIVSLFSFLEMYQLFGQQVFFWSYSNTDTPTDQEIRAWDLQGNRKVAKPPCMEIVFLNLFMKQSRWWAARPSNSMKFLRWRDFNCVAAPRSFIDITRKARCLKVIPQRRHCSRLLSAMALEIWIGFLYFCCKCTQSFRYPVFFQVTHV